MAGHEIVEKNSFVLLIMTIIVISVAGMVQIVPLFFIDETTTPVE
jgi:cytochrome c oxidase cbb3-type subunit 2